jgi:hypothetical protein
VDLNLFGNRTENKDFGISDRSKRGYRQYRTWVEEGKWCVGVHPIGVGRLG